MLLILSLLLIGIGLWLGMSKYRELKHSAIAQGTVVELVGWQKGGSKLKASFQASDGKVYQYLSAWESSLISYQPNDPIRIYYKQDTPEVNGIADFGIAFGSAVVLIALGLTLLALWGVFANGELLMQRCFPMTPMR